MQGGVPREQLPAVCSMMLKGLNGLLEALETSVLDGSTDTPRYLVVATTSAHFVAVFASFSCGAQSGLKENVPQLVQLSSET